MVYVLSCDHMKTCIKFVRNIFVGPEGCRPYNRFSPPKDKDEDNDKDKMLKRPITCYIFEKQGVQGYQIGHLQWRRQWPRKRQWQWQRQRQRQRQRRKCWKPQHRLYFLKAEDKRISNMTRPGQRREESNLADLILELAFFLLSVMKMWVTKCIFIN